MSSSPTVMSRQSSVVVRNLVVTGVLSAPRVRDVLSAPRVRGLLLHMTRRGAQAAPRPNPASARCAWPTGNTGRGDRWCRCRCRRAPAASLPRLARRPRPPRTSRCAASRPGGRSWPRSQAACHIVQRMASTSMKASAIRCCTAWKLPIGLPNCSRSRGVGRRRCAAPARRRRVGSRTTRPEHGHAAIRRCHGHFRAGDRNATAPSRMTSPCGSPLVVVTGRTSTPAACASIMKTPTSSPSSAAGTRIVPAS